jgi:hypothetical protein
MPEFVEAKSMMLLPPPDGHCRICAVNHEPEAAHNAQSLFYQARFFMRYKRNGTWADAVAHCTAEAQELWKWELIKLGGWTEPPEGVEPICEPIDG